MKHIRIEAGQPVTETDLHAYVDGELDAVRRAQVEAHLAAHPADAARINAYNAQTLGLHVLYSGADAPHDGEIDALAAQLDRTIRRRTWFRGAFRVAAVVAALVGVMGIAWKMHGQFAKSDDPFLAFTQQARDAHMLFAGRQPEVTESPETEQANVVSWLSQRLTGIPLQAPDLSQYGYGLTIERILPSTYGPAAQLMYEHKKQSMPVTLFIGKNRNARQVAFTFVQNDEVSIFYWHDGPLAYSLAGRLDRKNLLELAEEVSAQLTALPPVPKRFVQHPGRGTVRAANDDAAKPDVVVKEVVVKEEKPVEMPAEGNREDRAAEPSAADKQPSPKDTRIDRVPAAAAPADTPAVIPAASQESPKGSETPVPLPVSAPAEADPKKT